MVASLNRRQFLSHVAGGAVAATLVRVDLRADEKKVPAPTLTVIAGKPRERGRLYGQKFKDGMHAFLDREIYQAFEKKPSTRDEMLRYGAACGKAIREYAPLIHDEMEGMAENSGVRFEELVLMNLHEELGRKRALPKVDHCTAVAAGPPDTRDGQTYVGQTWDWMTSVAGLSSMLLWKRPEGPSLLAYAYPGLWVGAGLSSAGLALCWTSAGPTGKDGPRVGIPSYVLIAQILYQETLKDAIAEAKRATHAGWFTFVLADGAGQLANIEGSPKELAVELNRGRLARVGFGSRQMTATAEGASVKYHARCQKMYDLLGAAKDKLDGAALQDTFGDPKAGICAHPGTIDMMVFNCTKREALVSRGAGYGVEWKRFTFDSKE